MIQELELLLVAAGVECKQAGGGIRGTTWNWWCMSGFNGDRIRVSDRNSKAQYADSVAQAFLLVLECQ